jgi:predicted hydrocarbon binding protein
VSSTIDASASRATPVGTAALLPRTGRALDARLPLSLLEAVKAIDTPDAELEAEFVEELRNKRLGLSETVLQQIRRYAEAVKRQQRIPFDEVLALARLIGRRQDADLAFREAGRRWARSALETVGGVARRGATGLPAVIGRPLALRQLRRLAVRFLDGALVRQGSTLLLEVRTPVSVDAAAPGVGCGLYEAAFRELLLRLADADGAVDHVLCRAQGGDRCQWRADWRRR